MVNLSVRAIASKCLKQAAPISLKEHIFSVDGIPSPNSLKSALQFIRDFRCPPAAPTNLRITAVGEESIAIAWDDNADNEDGFEVIWTGRRAFSQHDDGSRKLNDPNRNDFTLTGLFPNYEYCIRVRAFNAGGNSDTSNEECATIPDSSPQPAQGFSQVSLFNCHVDRRAVNIWMRDITTGSAWSQQGSLSAPPQGQPCPAANASPVVVSLPDEHSYEIVAVDPSAIACGGNNDPQIASCRRYANVFIGNPDGSSTQATII